VKIKEQHMDSRKKGFTLVEVMVSLSLTSLVVIGGFNIFISSARHFQDGTEHNTFINEARAAEQKILNYIQNARAISVTSGNASSLDIVQSDLTVSRLYYVAGNSPETSTLTYDPNSDPDVVGDEEILCRYVSEIPNVNLFQILPNTTSTTKLSFYVGLRPPTNGETAGVRKSYTGAMVYMSATPRNNVDFIQN